MAYNYKRKKLKKKRSMWINVTSKWDSYYMELHYYKDKTGALYCKWLNSIYLYKSYIYQIYKTFLCWSLSAHTTEKNSHLIVVFSCFLQQETLHFYFSLGLQNCVASPIFLNINKYILCVYSVYSGARHLGWGVGG